MCTQKYLRSTAHETELVHGTYITTANLAWMYYDGFMIFCTNASEFSIIGRLMCGENSAQIDAVDGYRQFESHAEGPNLRWGIGFRMRNIRMVQ